MDVETKPQQYQQSSRRSGRRLRFSTYDEVFEIPHINDLSEEEVDGVWMSQNELNSVRRNAKCMVALMDKGDTLMEGLDVRGLDQNTPSYARRREAILKLVYQAVFRIQSYQNANGIKVPELMAELCQKVTSSSVAAAQKLAMLDAAAASGPRQRTEFSNHVERRNCYINKRSGEIFSR
jgi:hypothetical protein